MNISIKAVLRKYEKKNRSKATNILILTLSVVLCLFIVNYQLAINHFYFALIPLIFAQSLFLVKLFMVFHDCGHQSYFKSNKWNRRVGRLIGLVMLVPLDLWNVIHNKHHGSSGNLNERSILDVITLTLDEYEALTWYKKLGYRMFRTMGFQLFLYQQLVFIIGFRIPFGFFSTKGQKAVVLNNTIYLGLGLLINPFIHWQLLVITVLPVYLITFAIGSYIFYIQHQYEEAYWIDKMNYDFEKAGIEGSSFWNLPSWGHWITGNIGFHHIHHLNVGIPNYNLEQAHKAILPEVKDKIISVDILSSFTLYRYKLFDKKRNIMIPFP